MGNVNKFTNFFFKGLLGYQTVDYDFFFPGRKSLGIQSSACLTSLHTKNVEIKRRCASKCVRCMQIGTLPVPCYRIGGVGVYYGVNALLSCRILTKMSLFYQSLGNYRIGRSERYPFVTCIGHNTSTKVM